MKNKTIKAIENKLSPIFKKIEGKLNVEAKTAIGIVAALALAIAIHASLPQPNDITNSSVAITNIAENSGGTGIILSSSETSSTVLTNSHVCHVVEHGGKVTGMAGSFLVATYKHSQSHDLCLITVDGNLKASTKVSDRAPTPYYENAMVSGHPALYPNVITTGHFSGRRVIAIMKGMKPCTKEQQENPNTALLCLLAGGIPQIQQYDATLVTATIMPGSSGSGVYNKDKELSGVVFAGQGNLGYGWTVPFESMRNFLDLEARTLEAVRPDNIVNFAGEGDRKTNSEEEMLNKLKEACSGENKVKLGETCKLLDENLIWNK